MTWGKRRHLPNRREHNTIKFKHAFDMGQNEVTYYLGIGLYPDGTLGETFINTTKASSPQEAYAKDAAILLSIAIQYGVPLRVIQSAMTRSADGLHPHSPIGAMVDVLVKREE